MVSQEEIRKKIEEYREWMLDVRHWLHRHPETGDGEYETTAYIEKLLKEMGLRTEKPLPTGVIGILDAENTGGKCIALRADIDALPVQEETELSFRSQRDGFMHACGHDMHMAGTSVYGENSVGSAGFSDRAGKISFSAGGGGRTEERSG